MYILSILNSKVVHFVYKQTASTKQGGYFEQKPMYIENLPIPPHPSPDTITPLMEQQLAAHEGRAKAGSHDVPLCDQKIALLDARIDAEVYKLYDLTSEEIAVVEGRG